MQSIILAGGSTRIPKVKQLLTDYFGRALDQTLNPDECVAQGAAIMAAKKQALKFDEAVPKSLGVGVGDKLGVLIPKNTKIPCVAEKDYVNRDSGKEYIGLVVYQGDNPDGAGGPIPIENCDKIGHLIMRGFGKYEQG